MKKILSVMILSIILFEARFFYVVNLPSFIEGFNNYHIKIIIVILIFITLIFVLAAKDKMLIYNSGYFNRFILIGISLVIIESIFSYLEYSQGIKALIMCTHTYYILLLYFLLVYYHNKYNSILFLKNTIILFGAILSSIFLLQAMIYNAGGSMFLHISEFNSVGIESRLGNVRITYPSTLISISVLLSFAEILKVNNNKRYRILNLLSTIVCFLYLILVCQTRMLIICIILSMLLTLLVRYSHSITKFLSIVILLFIVVIGIFQLDYTKQFINTFSDSANKISTVARFEAYSYFLQQGLENLGFGRGFILTGQEDNLDFVAEGPTLSYKVTDLGIVGLFAMFGFFGVVWYSWLLIRLSRYLIYIYRNNSITECIELVSLHALLVTTSVTLISTNGQRMIMLPIILSLFDYYIYKAKLNDLNNQSL